MAWRRELGMEWERSPGPTLAPAWYSRQQAASSEEQNVGSETASNPQPPRNRTFETF